MSVEYSTGFCKNCGKKKKLVRKGTNHILHLILSIITCGFWIIIWILASIFKDHWRCDTCGRKIGLFR